MAEGLIAPESRRLLREARRAQRMGFDRTADELAAKSFAQKLVEPTIWKDGQREEMTNLKEKLEGEKIAGEQRSAAEQLAGRQAFAGQIKSLASEKPEEAYSFASQEAPKYGVTPSALASFFERNKLPVDLSYMRGKEKEEKPGSNSVAGINTNSLIRR